MEEQYVVEMLNITKEFPGIIANDNITLQLKKGEIHTLLGENGAGKSTLMSILFGLYQPTKGIIKKDGVEVKINNPNDATALHIGMVHQHFKLVECISVLKNIIMGVEPIKVYVYQKTVVGPAHLSKDSKCLNAIANIPTSFKRFSVRMKNKRNSKKDDYQEIPLPENKTIKGNKFLDGICKFNNIIGKGLAGIWNGMKFVFKYLGLYHVANFLNKHIFHFIDYKKAKDEVNQLSNQYGLYIDPDAKIQDITVGMQQRTEILKMLYRKNDILIFDEPTAVLTPQEIKELMQIMKNLVKEGKSILFITHKMAEILEVGDRCTILRKGKYIGTVPVKGCTKETLSEMMVGHKVNLVVDKTESKPTDVVLDIQNLTVIEKARNIDAVRNVSFQVRKGEIVCIAGIDGNGQTELVYGISGLETPKRGKILLNGVDITHLPIRKRNLAGVSHIPEDRHKHGLVLDYSLEENIALQKYFQKEFQKCGFINFKARRKYSDEIIQQYDVRSGQGSITKARSMSGGNQQKAIVGREIDRDTDLLIAVQPTRGLDVGAIEYIHKQIVNQRDKGKAVLLVSLELDEVLALSDRILVMHKGEIVAELNPKKTTREEIGLYMAGGKEQK